MNLVIEPEIKEAIQSHHPVVALESTIISHGMPYPQNVETALEVEQVIQNEGAIPATIAVIEGQIRIGLKKSEIELFGKNSAQTSILKLSRRDLAYAVTRRCTGSTTVAATMVCAELAQIPVFVTGGIGGVHREAEKTFDISADLQELSKSKVTVISAGAKSILDIGLTLEVLETLGVPVIGYQTDLFPAFYCSNSQFPIEHRLDEPREIAKLMKMHWRLSSPGGILIVNPVPKEKELSSHFIENHINEGLRLAQDQGIRGKKITPFLLSYLASVTHGKSLETNIALILNNAKLGAQVAVSYSSLKSGKH